MTPNVHILGIPLFFDRIRQKDETHKILNLTESHRDVSCSLVFKLSTENTLYVKEFNPNFMQNFMTY